MVKHLTFSHLITSSLHFYSNWLLIPLIKLIIEFSFIVGHPVNTHMHNTHASTLYNAHLQRSSIWSHQSLASSDKALLVPHQGPDLDDVTRHPIL